MSDKYIIDGDTLIDIADAIRAKTGTVEEIAPTDMADLISNISGGGGFSRASVVIGDFVVRTRAGEVV